MRKFSLEHRKKLSIAKLGHTYNRNRKHTKESRKNMSLAHIGLELTKKQLHNLKTINIGRKHSKEFCEKIGLIHKGLKHSIKTKKKISSSKKGCITWNKGKEMSKVYREKVSKSLKGKIGINSRNWQGGKTSLIKRLRNSNKWKDWRGFVFVRDNYTCKICNKRGIIIHPHHLLPVAKFLQFIFETWNGVTLCKSCHIEIHKIMKMEEKCLMKLYQIQML